MSMSCTNRPVDVLVKDIAIGAESLWFDSHAGQVGHYVANGSQPLRRFFRSCVTQALTREDSPAICYTLRRNIASQKKIWGSILLNFCALNAMR